MRALGPVFVLGALLPACADEGITGFWKGTLSETPEAEITLTIEERDGNVMGSAELFWDGFVQSEVRGSVENEWVELGFPQLAGAAHYKAGLQGDEAMTGTWTMHGEGQKLTLERVR